MCGQTHNAWGSSTTTTATPGGESSAEPAEEDRHHSHRHGRPTKSPTSPYEPVDDQTSRLLQRIKANRTGFVFMGRSKVTELATHNQWCVPPRHAPLTG